MQQVLVVSVHTFAGQRRCKNNRGSKLERILPNVLLDEVKVLVEELGFLSVLQKIHLLAYNYDWNSQVHFQHTFGQWHVQASLFQVHFVITASFARLFIIMSSLSNEVTCFVELWLLVFLDMLLNAFFHFLVQPCLHLRQQFEQTLLEHFHPPLQLVHHFPGGVQVEDNSDCELFK